MKFRSQIVIFFLNSLYDSEILGIIARRPAIPCKPQNDRFLYRGVIKTASNLTNDNLSGTHIFSNFLLSSERVINFLSNSTAFSYLKFFNL